MPSDRRLNQEPIKIGIATKSRWAKTLHENVEKMISRDPKGKRYSEYGTETILEFYFF